MQNSKEFFLSTLGIADYDWSLLLAHDLKLQRKNEKEPFGEIVTMPSGKVILRVGDAFEDGIKVIVP